MKQKSRRIVLISLAALLAVAAVTFAVVRKRAQAHAPFFVQSLQCPADIMEYVSEDPAFFTVPMDKTRSVDADTIWVGQPFTYGDQVPNLFTFPLYSGDEVTQVVRVGYAPDGTIGGLTKSTFLVDELNAYRNRTSKDCPLLFDVIDNAFYACFGDTKEIIFEFSEWDCPDPQSYAPDRVSMEVETVNIAVPVPLRPDN